MLQRTEAILSHIAVTAMLHADGKAFGVWRPLLLSDQDSRSATDKDLLQRLVDLTETAKCWAVILSKGGHFAAAIFDLRPTLHAQHGKADALHFKELAHKSFHRYVVRLVSVQLIQPLLCNRGNLHVMQAILLVLACFLPTYIPYPLQTWKDLVHKATVYCTLLA